MLTLLLLAYSYMALFSKNLNLRRDHKKKSFMSVATMSRKTKRVYLRFCPEKRRKNSKGKELK